MRKYVKPIAVVNSNVAEGVYAASGASAVGNGAYSLKEVAAWSQNKQYDVDFTNTSSEEVDSVTVVMTIHGDVYSVTGNISATITGNTVTVTYNNHGNGLKPNETISKVYLLAQGNGDFYLE